MSEVSLMSSTIAVIAKIPVQSGRREEVLAAIAGLVDLARSEDGTTTYVVHEDNKDPDAVWVYEQYADQAALDVHMRADGMKAFIDAAGPMMGGAPELHFLTPVQSLEE
ncbi:MAG: antibiotic biosynthesis monooxygenase [Actinomycetota bacterium]|nr:antibiotic biosynthesis monooxygenase [Actinomycetota bacterium]